MIVRWVFVMIGLLMSAGLAYVNLRIMILPSKDSVEGQHSSCVPFAGGIIGAAALLLSPIHEASYWCWVPFLVDPGSGYYTFLIMQALWQSRKSSDQPQNQDEDSKTK